MRYKFTITALVASVHAHTWIEQLNIIASNGTMIGQPGFPRGNVKRGTPGFGDPAMVNLIPPNPRSINQILSTDLMCKDTQVKQQQGNGDRLKAPAGSNVALRYQENGHVSLPQGQPGKPENRGTVFVYGTTEPREDDKFLSIHRVWNAEGTGGDKRGVLLSTQNYDDGQCYQINGGQISSKRQKTFSHAANSLMGADLWCQQDIQIPKDAPSGKPYTLYWVWDWPTMPGTAGFPEGKQEFYTTCMDIDVTQATNVQQKAAGAAFVSQDLGNAAVSAQLANIANPTAVKAQFIPFSGASNTPTGAASTGATSQPTNTPVQSNPAKQSSSLVATGIASSAAQTVSSLAPSSTGRNGRPFSSRPAINPVGTASPPFSQPANSGRPTGQPAASGLAGQSDSKSTGTARSATAQNTGTAIQQGAAVTTAANQPVSTIIEMKTEIKTVMQTRIETVYAGTTPAAVQSTKPAKRAQQTSATESAYLLRARNFFHQRH